MSTRTLTEFVQSNIIAYLRQSVYTSIPATILKVNNFEEQQTVVVKPLINRVYEDGVILEPSNIFEVPVVFPSAGGGLLSFPIQEGDTVLLVFSMRSIEEWLNSDGGQRTPSNNRHYSLTDAIAIPGLYTKETNLNPNPTDVELKFNNLSFKLEKESGDITLENPTHSFKLKADGSVLHSSGAQITADGDFITASGISLDNHIHSQGVDSNGDTQVDVDPPQ